ncbi:MAG TPA: glycosyltransferase family 4 protein [Elusimicrobiota bacterium]|nr:glycosyltransferase family 4 protein [Elusimicrobiota bacterium]
MTRLKVVHVVTQLELGGAQQNTLHTVRRLNRAEFEPFLLCGPGGILDAEAGRESVPVTFVSALQRAVHPFKDPAAFFQLRRAFRSLRPDIVHTHSSKAGILGRWAAWSAGVPVVLHTFHGFGFTPGQSAPVRAAYVAAERWTARISTALVAVSRANRDEALARGIGRPDQFHLIRSGVPLGPYRSLAPRREPPAGIDLRPEEKLVLTIGPFKPQKNLKDFVRAAAAVLQRRSDVKFLVVGDGEGRLRLEEDLRRRGVADRVILAGWRRDVPALLARTDVFCMTSLWEGLPRSLVEAMAAGRPCVVNAVDGCRDLIEDGVNGFLIPPRHPLSTAERLLQILSDDELSDRLGRRARETVGDEFDIDGMVRAQEDLYRVLWAARPGPASPQ